MHERAPDQPDDQQTGTQAPGHGHMRPAAEALAGLEARLRDARRVGASRAVHVSAVGVL